MDINDIISGKGPKLIPLSEAAKLVPYSAQYLSLRARQKKFWAIKFNRDWLTTKDAILTYARGQEEKHVKALRRLRSK